MTLAAPAILLTAAVTLLAVLIATGMGILVARTRARTKVPPPAMTGHPYVERALRVQGNTLEQIVTFLPSLWLAALYFQGWVPPIIGLVWCVGRILYAFGYMSETAGRRAPGFVMTQLSTILLAILAIIGIAKAWMAATAV